MTLDTGLFVQGDVDPMIVHRKVEELLGIPDTARREIKDGEIFNKPGQGFAAWVMTRHGQGEEVPANTHEEWCDEDCSREHAPAYWVKVSMDTSYGYRGENGEGCGTLHGRVVVQLGEWLATQGVGLIWENEYDGTYASWDDVDAMRGFLGGEEEAGEWFNNVVKPYIESQGGTVY